MSIVAWVLIGLILGLIASKVVNATSQSVIVNVLLGAIGAVAGGLVFHSAEGSGIDDFEPLSLVVAVVGAFVMLVVKHALVKRGRIHL